MLFLGYPIEIWAASFVAVLIKISANKKLTILGAFTTVIVALFSGVILYQPILAMFALDSTWAIPLAIIIALSAENLMKAILQVSEDREWLVDTIKFFVNRKSRRNEDDQ